MGIDPAQAHESDCRSAERIRSSLVVEEIRFTWSSFYMWYLAQPGRSNQRTAVNVSGEAVSAAWGIAESSPEGVRCAQGSPMRNQYVLRNCTDRELVARIFTECLTTSISAMGGRNSHSVTISDVGNTFCARNG